MNPGNYKEIVAEAHQADEELTKQAIDSALEAKQDWENMPWNDR